MIRIGIIDFDVSHCVAFAQRLNHKKVDEELWVDGAQAVLGWTGPSEISPERIEGHRKQLTEELGVRLVDRPEDMIGKVDGVLIESGGGSVHYERAEPFLKAGVPCFIDKPFTCSLADARKLAELASKNNVALFSSSSLRYGLEIQELDAKREETGEVIGAATYSPCSTHPVNPGLFHYGIHGVEMLYAILGPGCRSVSAVWQDGAAVVTGVWEDGRAGSVRGIREGARGYGFTAFCEKQIVNGTLNARYIYRELLKRVVEMFQTGKAPLDINESLEIVAFIEAALGSQNNQGAWVSLPTI